VSELSRRVLVAIVAAPVALGLIWLGGAPLAALAASLSAIASWEFYRIARAAGHAPLVPLGVGIAAILPLVVHAVQLGLVQPGVAPIVLVPLVVMGATLWARGADGRPLGAASSTVLGVLYTAAPLSFAYALRYHRFAIGDMAGALMVIVPVVLTWASDTGAYFSGRLIGGRKLMPTVSPGKTVAGAIGAVVATVLATWALTRGVLMPQAQLAFTPLGTLLFGVIVSVVAQIGDLVESLLKREAGVKDSGTLFPGHGGVLDRLDSVFFVLPVAWVLYDLLLIPAPSAFGGGAP